MFPARSSAMKYRLIFPGSLIVIYRLRRHIKQSLSKTLYHCTIME